MLEILFYICIISWHPGPGSKVEAELARLSTMAQCEQMAKDLRTQGYTVSPCVALRVALDVTGQ